MVMKFYFLPRRQKIQCDPQTLLYQNIPISDSAFHKLGVVYPKLLNFQLAQIFDCTIALKLTIQSLFWAVFLKCQDDAIYSLNVLTTFHRESKYRMLLLIQRKSVRIISIFKTKIDVFLFLKIVKLILGQTQEKWTVFKYKGIDRIKWLIKEQKCQLQSIEITEDHFMIVMVIEPRQIREIFCIYTFLRTFLPTF